MRIRLFAQVLPLFLVGSAVQATQPLEILLESSSLVHCDVALIKCAPGVRVGTLNEQSQPGTGPRISWKGIVLSAWIERLLAKIPLSERSLIDLVILKNAQGQERMLPRWVVTRYPVLIATHRGGKAAPPGIVLPWTSRPKLLTEELPLEALQLGDLQEIRLTSWKGRLGAALLERRTDPVAMRGEKLHAKNCVVCHSDGLIQKPYGGLPKVGASHQLGAPAVKSLQRYFETLQEERASATVAPSDGRGPGAVGRASPWSRHLVR